MNQHYAALEFYVIVETLKAHALSQRAKNKLDGLAPYLSEEICVRKMAETTAARRLLDQLGSPPLALMDGLDEAVTLSEAGGMLVPEQLCCVARFAESCRRMGAWLKRGEASGEALALYGRGIEDLSPLHSEIERCVNGEAVCDDASPALKNIRRKLEHLEAQIKEKLSHILQSRKAYLSDGYITVRQGRYVLPVQRKYQNQFGGAVVEVSGKGATVFMEPSAVSRLSQDRSALALEEDAEVRRVLYTLAASVAEAAGAIRRNAEAMEVLDVLFAKAKLSAAMKAVPVAIGGERRLDIRQGRHPLLDESSCVPLDCRMDAGTSGIIITGPNTGGKTVACKTVGLLSLMAQCGLHIPCSAGSYIAMQDGYFCDIGDSQNISQNLSTFSGHMTNVIHILQHAGRDSLVLLDELGSGTDPAEGMGIAIAILEELRRRGGMFLVTTHYPQVKAYASNTDGVMSARMAFDRDSLQPLYRLEMGKTGESCALSIARHLGLAPQLLARAHREVYGECPGDAPNAECMQVPASRLIRQVPAREGADLSAKFVMGDSVTMLPGGEIAIVYRPADEHGEVVVQLRGEKRKIRHNRLKLRVPACELYPPDYDFSVVFDTVANRKARHQMGKRHDPGQIIVYEEGEA